MKQLTTAFEFLNGLDLFATAAEKKAVVITALSLTFNFELERILSSLKPIPFSIFSTNIYFIQVKASDLSLVRKHFVN
jgi:hypothetical protein